MRFTRSGLSHGMRDVCNDRINIGWHLCRCRWGIGQVYTRGFLQLGTANKIHKREVEKMKKYKLGFGLSTTAFVACVATAVYLIHYAMHCDSTLIVLAFMALVFDALAMALSLLSVKSCYRCYKKKRFNCRNN